MFVLLFLNFRPRINRREADLLRGRMSLKNAPTGWLLALEPFKSSRAVPSKAKAPFALLALYGVIRDKKETNRHTSPFRGLPGYVGLVVALGQLKAQKGQFFAQPGTLAYNIASNATRLAYLHKG